ncbi:glycosyl transferase group 1 [Stanieria cyanosphaera PCC 7437]|uniref:Glycosyl transferase group 1 n=1 Tax=Stanieria cyanosphaera (strain ATCC 29371 / PCC 7437) TaxID=111780 RepID=K9XVT1_STAC7|nr:glycosyltransferase family 4 protein [Stanieria cyanosphaera]AFZ35782.1 glycosyl transferase group 1 [Stanieria cyanosphaera PCC 7437]
MKLAIITSHPIQYYAPWFSYINQNTNLELKVFYLWNFGITETIDLEFKKSIKWDIPLLDGYNYEFVPNVSKNPGTKSIKGLQNPTLLSTVAKYNPDAVMLIGYNYASLYRFIFQWNINQAPLIFRGDSHLLQCPKGWKASFRRKFISLIYSRFAAFLYVGKANYEYFTYHEVKSKQLFFAPHAIDNNRFLQAAEPAKKEAIKWKKELGIPDHNKVILFAGKFNSKKRPLDLLQAYKQANLKDVVLLFVGGGELETELKKQAAEHPNIFFAPFQNQQMMPRTYAIADLFILPSYGYGETWGLAVNEAMCLSCPIIVSNHVGCGQDLVKPYHNGLIFEAGNISDLTKLIKLAFSNSERLKQWSFKSSEIIQQYSYQQTTEGLLKALSHI